MIAVNLTIACISLLTILRLYLTNRWFTRASDILRDKLRRADIAELSRIGEQVNRLEKEVNPLPMALNLTIWTFEKAYPWLN